MPASRMWQGFQRKEQHEAPRKGLSLFLTFIFNMTIVTCVTTLTTMSFHVRYHSMLGARLRRLPSSHMRFLTFALSKRLVLFLRTTHCRRPLLVSTITVWIFCWHSLAFVTVLDLRGLSGLWGFSMCWPARRCRLKPPLEMTIGMCSYTLSIGDVDHLSVA